VTIQVLNGPNLGRLGLREPEKYGTTTHAELVDLVEATGRQMGVEVRVRPTAGGGYRAELSFDDADQAHELAERLAGGHG